MKNSSDIENQTTEKNIEVFEEPSVSFSVSAPSEKNFETQDTPQECYVLPLSKTVLFPGMLVPLIIPEGLARNTVNKIPSEQSYLMLVAKKNETEDPKKDDLYSCGIFARILKTIRLPENQLSIIVQCLYRIKIVEWLEVRPLLRAKVRKLKDEMKKSPKLDALFRNTQLTVDEIIKLNATIPDELNVAVLNIEDPSRLADFVSGHFLGSVKDKQMILETMNVQKRLNLVFELLRKELSILKLGQKIEDEIRQKAEKQQKEFFLREQMKAIRTELGEESESKEGDFANYEKKIQALKMNKEAEKRAYEQINRLKSIPPEATEYHMIRTYLDCLVDLPWSKITKDRHDINKAETILDRDHFGLKDVKERIIEFLAVRKLNPDQKGTILCFVGPPGVGKTSLGKSIAEALGRKLYRFSLGGMRDEAEIKGHRRTYIGAMCGKILQGLRTAGTNNPVFMLDEVDKVGQDWRGDPASALLEVLDPEQNSAFLDHYLDVPYDLSKVMFICTANVKHTIPRALRDRMEFIEIPGYIPEEKSAIAEKYLVKKRMKANGLKTDNIVFSKKVFPHIIRHYTQESGVRNLEREIGKICRKVATKIAKGDKRKTIITLENIHEYLGRPKIIDDLPTRLNQPGTALGLAWTEFGGDILLIEATIMKGKSQIITTGKLGKVMKESAQIALSYVKTNAKKFGINGDIFRENDIHIHFPAGAVPKDGPSAGVTIATALISLLHTSGGMRVKNHLAMTGEITLHGDVLPVGGIREKMVAARRAGLKEVILPKLNQHDLDEMPVSLKEKLNFHLVENYEQILPLVFPLHTFEQS